MDKLGLGYEHVRAVNPDVVYVSLSGFGSEGPYRDRSAYDTVIQAYGGFADQPGRPRRRRAGVPAPDRRRQGHRAVRVPGDHRRAVRARANGAGGQHIELSMTDAVVSFLWADSARQRGAARLRRLDELVASSPASGRCASPTAGASSRRPPTTTSPACAARSTSTATTTRGSRRSASGASTARCMEPIMDMVLRAGRQPHAMAEATARFEAERVPFAMILSPEELAHDDARGRDRAVRGGTTITSSGGPACPATPRASRGTPAQLGKRLTRRSASTPTRSSRSWAWATTSATCGLRGWSRDHADRHRDRRPRDRVPATRSIEEKMAAYDFFRANLKDAREPAGDGVPRAVHVQGRARRRRPRATDASSGSSRRWTRSASASRSVGSRPRRHRGAAAVPRPLRARRCR